MKTILMILFVSANTLGSQLILKKGLVSIGKSFQQDGIISFLLSAIQSPLVLLAIILQGVGFLVWILVISKEKIGFAFALSGAFFYLLIAILGNLFFDEKLTAYQWIGIGLITAGVLLMAGDYQS